MKEDVRELNLNRRIHCLDLRITFLKRLIDEPTLNDREIRRRRVCIAELIENIRKHVEVIDKLTEQSTKAERLLEEAEKQRKSLIRLRSAHVIQTLIADYTKVRKSLEDATC